MSAKWLPLEEWASAHYSKPPGLQTLRAWARLGHFYPAAERHGRAYVVLENARYVESTIEAEAIAKAEESGLLARIGRARRHGTKAA